MNLCRTGQTLLLVTNSKYVTMHLHMTPLLPHIHNREHHLETSTCLQCSHPPLLLISKKLMPHSQMIVPVFYLMFLCMTMQTPLPVMNKIFILFLLRLPPSTSSLPFMAFIV